MATPRSSISEFPNQSLTLCFMMKIWLETWRSIARLLCRPAQKIWTDTPAALGIRSPISLHTATFFPALFPLPSGNVRRQKFIDIWRDSPQLAEVRSIHARDLPVCSTCPHMVSCSRCPGLAYMEGNMRGPSTADCEKSFQRTGIASANMLRNGGFQAGANLVQIQPLPA